jgi:preprotein translocase subunit SecA
MMGEVEDNFVRYVSRVEVVVDEQPRPQARNIQYSAPEDPVQGASSMRQTAAQMPPEMLDAGAPVAEPVDEVVNTPVRVEKTPGRNEPCPCGSGKKYKLCHGR